MKKEKFKKFLQSKTTRIIILCIAALLLLIIVWKVFFPKSSKSTSAANLMTEDEVRLSTLLVEIDGVDEVTVFIRKEEGNPVSAVVLFRGQDSILVRTYLTEMTAKALGIAQRDVLIQPAN